MPSRTNTDDNDNGDKRKKNARLSRDVNKKFEVIVNHKLMLVNAEDSQQKSECQEHIFDYFWKVAKMLPSWPYLPQRKSITAESFSIRRHTTRPLSSGSAPP